MSLEADLAEIRKKLAYDPETGVFTRLIRGGAVLAGGEAGYVRPDGYRYIRVGDKQLLAHRIAWVYMTGTEPSDAVDHVNLDRSDNRWANLREASRSQNNSNVRSRASSGFKGAYFRPEVNKFAAKLHENGKLRHLGLFCTAEEAHAAYRKAATEKLGEFARFD